MRKIINLLLVAMFVITPFGNVLAASEYTVVKGDTLWSISQKNKVTVQEIKNLNKLKSDVIYVGQKLKTTKDAVDKKPTETSKPTETKTETHVVKSGDTLWSISLKYKVSVNDIMSWNNLKSTVIVVNQKLNIEKPKSSTTTEQEKTITATTTTDLHFRERPEASSPSLGIMPKGASVKVLDNKAQWWKIEYKGKVGYSNSKYLKASGSTVTKPSEPTPAPVTVRAKTTANLYFRETASPNGKAIKILSQGTVVEVLKSSGDWWNIKVDGKTGYSHKNYLQIIKDDSEEVTPKNKIVVIDPGHGGKDPGAVNGSVQEKQINLAHGLKVKKYLEDLGYTVYMTRTTDTTCQAANNLGYDDLNCRVVFAANKKADIFVSIHANASIPGVRGTETFYNETSNYDGNKNPYPAQSKQLANNVHTKFQPVFGSNNRGVKNNNLYVNRMAKMPSILLELGFITDTTDKNKMIDPGYQDRVSKAIAQGVDNYFSK